MSSSNSTPTQKSTSRKQNQNSYNSSLRASARQQDAQARNKDAYEDYSSDSSTRGRLISRVDSYETKQKKREAAIILDSPDLLMMYAQARGDSIPGTRLFYMKQLCSYEDAPKAPMVSKGVSGSGSASREREKAREKEEEGWKTNDNFEYGRFHVIVRAG